MRSTRGFLSCALLAALAVLGLWTGWTADILAWGSGHLGDLILDRVAQQSP